MFERASTEIKSAGVFRGEMDKPVCFRKSQPGRSEGSPKQAYGN